LSNPLRPGSNVGSVPDHGAWIETGCRGLTSGAPNSQTAPGPIVRPIELDQYPIGPVGYPDRDFER
jgi:hypothetical protein